MAMKRTGPCRTGANRKRTDFPGHLRTRFPGVVRDGVAPHAGVSRNARTLFVQTTQEHRTNTACFWESLLSPPTRGAWIEIQNIATQPPPGPRRPLGGGRDSEIGRQRRKKAFPSNFELMDRHCHQQPNRPRLGGACSFAPCHSHKLSSNHQTLVNQCGFR